MRVLDRVIETSRIVKKALRLRFKIGQGFEQDRRAAIDWRIDEAELIFRIPSSMGENGLDGRSQAAAFDVIHMRLSA